jgi:hypothetical protein
MNDLIKITTPEGEQSFPLSNVRRILRRRFEVDNKAAGKPQAASLRLDDHAIGLELKKGELVWSCGSSDWYYSGEPAWGE